MVFWRRKPPEKEERRGTYVFEAYCNYCGHTRMHIIEIMLGGAGGTVRCHFCNRGGFRGIKTLEEDFFEQLDVRRPEDS